MIEAERLSRRYGDFVAVDDVSFKIGAGEIVGLLGHNGAGKTTIMKMLTGYLEPSSGQARIAGIEVESDRQAAQFKLGYLPENLPLYPEMMVADYLCYVANLRGVEAQTAVKRAIAETELQDKALAPIATLSRGFKQRVGVAQAIIHEPACLILDEPTNGLDPGQTQHMRELITRLSERATVILSTHIMQEVDAICDRALILRGGALVLDERLEDLQSSNRLRLRSEAAASLLEPLRQLAPIDSAIQIAPGQFELAGRGELDAMAAAVARLCAEAEAPLYELSGVKRDLESVFREANEGAKHAI
ncbi:MAG: ABC transporter ATP-binding protein [Pseudomonadales bacterium]